MLKKKLIKWITAPIATIQSFMRSILRRLQSMIYEFEWDGLISIIFIQLILIISKLMNYVFWSWWIILIPLWLLFVYLPIGIILTRK